VDQTTRAGLTHRVLSYHVSTGELERVAQGVYRWARFPPHPYDMIAIAQHLRLPPLSWLRQACQETFKLRETKIPTGIPAVKKTLFALSRIRSLRRRQQRPWCR